MIRSFILLIIFSCFGTDFVTGSSHHDEIPHPHVELFNHHIYRIKGFLFGMLGMLSVIVASFIIYQFIIKRVRGNRSLFSERGALLPTTIDQPIFARSSFASFWPIKTLRDYHEQFMMTRQDRHDPPPPYMPISGYHGFSKPKPSCKDYDPWENL